MVVNKGRIHREIRYFQGISSNSIKTDDKFRSEIMDFHIFRKITQRQIHRIKSKIKSKINLIYDLKLKDNDTR